MTGAPREKGAGMKSRRRAWSFEGAWAVAPVLGQFLAIEFILATHAAETTTGKSFPRCWNPHLVVYSLRVGGVNRQCVLFIAATVIELVLTPLLLRRRLNSVLPAARRADRAAWLKAVREAPGPAGAEGQLLAGGAYALVLVSMAWGVLAVVPSLLGDFSLVVGAFAATCGVAAAQAGSWAYRKAKQRAVAAVSEISPPESWPAIGNLRWGVVVSAAPTWMRWLMLATFLALALSAARLIVNAAAFKKDLTFGDFSSFFFAAGAALSSTSATCFGAASGARRAADTPC